MALIKYGQGVASMSGKQGGSVHSRGRTGAIIRNWTKPCNPTTASQTQRRANFAGQTAAWGALTNAQRLAWNGWAQTQSRINRQGDVYVPTGRQMYIELNANLILAGQAAITAPPIGSVPPTVAAALGMTATITAGALTVLSVTGGSTDATVVYYVKGAPGQKTGRTNVNRQFRSLGSFTASAAVNILTGYTAIFGSVMAIGTQVQVLVKVINKTTGLASPDLLVLATSA
jgi:hypothetical protein